MRIRNMILTGGLVLALGMMSMPVYAAESEAAPETESEIGGMMNDVSCEIEDGILTIRIEQNEDTDPDPDFIWQAWNGDKGDASFVELITESDMEDGLAYAGSFRAIDDGEDTIRLVYTNGHYVKEYLDFNVRTEDGKIVENIGGGQAFPTTGEDLAPYLEGLWEENEDGNHFMDISLTDDGGLAFTISTGSTDDGEVTFYTMTAYYDCIKDALVYWDGAEHTGLVSVGQPETEAEAETEADGEGGTGIFGLELLDSDENPIGLTWQDDTFGNEVKDMFVKTDSES